MTNQQPDYDIAVIGGGPAGMAAAMTIKQFGASVVVLDENLSPGGQIYRAVDADIVSDPNILGEEYYRGRRLIKDFKDSGVETVSGAAVWNISTDREIFYTSAGSARTLLADKIILATGAQERPFPVPGWTLPGVMTAGSAQILLKSSGLASPNAVFAGTGPLLYLVAYQYIKAGVPVRAILDTAESGSFWRALPLLTRTVGKVGELIKGQGWINQIKKSGTQIIKGVKSLEMAGGESVSTVKYLAGGMVQSIETEAVFLHQGIVPNVNLTMATGCKHVWDETQLCWQAETDDWGKSSLDDVFVAGDGGAVAGAVAAEQQGRIVALAVLNEIGKLDQATRNRLAVEPTHILKREKRFRPFLDTLFRPAKSMRIPEQAETIVCRCEETTAAQIHDAISLGCTGPNQLKSFTRCGMGPCQGRFCGLTVSEMIADQTGLSVEEVGYYRLRPPVKPLTLAQLAGLDPASAAE